MFVRGRCCPAVDGYGVTVTADSSTEAATPPTGRAGGEGQRYRCAACGNLTRFDVVTRRRTRAFHHYSLGGDLSVEDVDVLEEEVEEVSCRWCGHGNAIEVLEPND